MTRGEFASLYKQIFPKGDSSEFADIIYDVYDVDGNGTVDFRCVKKSKKKQDLPIFGNFIIVMHILLYF